MSLGKRAYLKESQIGVEVVKLSPGFVISLSFLFYSYLCIIMQYLFSWFFSVTS